MSCCYASFSAAHKKVQKEQQKQQKLDKKKKDRKLICRSMCGFLRLNWTARAQPAVLTESLSSAAMTVVAVLRSEHKRMLHPAICKMSLTSKGLTGVPTYSINPTNLAQLIHKRPKIQELTASDLWNLKSICENPKKGHFMALIYTEALTLTPSPDLTHQGAEVNEGDQPFVCVSQIKRDLYFSAGPAHKFRQRRARRFFNC